MERRESTKIPAFAEEQIAEASYRTPLIMGTYLVETTVFVINHINHGKHIIAH